MEFKKLKIEIYTPHVWETVYAYCLDCNHKWEIDYPDEEPKNCELCGSSHIEY